MEQNMLIAFSDKKYDYYELTQSLGRRDRGGYLLPKGAIFVHDKFDNVLGSISSGCLKLCWTPKGNCYGGLCAETVIFHAEFRNTDLFKLVKTDQVLRKISNLQSHVKDLEQQLNDAKAELKQLER